MPVRCTRCGQRFPDIHGPEAEHRARTDGGVFEQDHRESACECIVKHEWEDDSDECRDEFTNVSTANVFYGLLCSRPDGHDGPHAACNRTEHPVMVWPQDDEEEEVPAE